MEGQQCPEEERRAVKGRRSLEGLWGLVLVDWKASGAWKLGLGVLDGLWGLFWKLLKASGA